MSSGEEVDVVIKRFIDDNLQPATEEKYCKILIKEIIYCQAP